MGEDDIEKPKNGPREQPEKTAAKVLEEKIIAAYGERLPKLEDQLELMLAAADATFSGTGNYRFKMDNVYKAAVAEYANIPDLMEMLQEFKMQLDNYLFES
jgi:dihydroxyacetone kinase